MKAWKKGSKYYIKGDDVCDLSKTLTPSHTEDSYLPRGSWHAVNPASMPFKVDSDFYGVLPTVDSGKFVAVKVNASGRVVGFSGMNTGAGTAMMSMGCWSSIIV